MHPFENTSRSVSGPCHHHPAHSLAIPIHLHLAMTRDPGWEKEKSQTPGQANPWTTTVRALTQQTPELATLRMRIPVLHTVVGKRHFLILIFSSLTEEETELNKGTQQTSQSQQLQRQNNFSLVEWGTSGVDKHKQVFCLRGSNHLKVEQKWKPQISTPAVWGNKRHVCGRNELMNEQGVGVWLSCIPCAKHVQLLGSLSSSSSSSTHILF